MANPAPMALTRCYCGLPNNLSVNTFGYSRYLGVMAYLRAIPRPKVRLGFCIITWYTVVDSTKILISIERSLCHVFLPRDIYLLWSLNYSIHRIYLTPQHSLRAWTRYHSQSRHFSLELSPPPKPHIFHISQHMNKSRFKFSLQIIPLSKLQQYFPYIYPPGVSLNKFVVLLFRLLLFLALICLTRCPIPPFFQIYAVEASRPIS